MESKGAEAAVEPAAVEGGIVATASHKHKGLDRWVVQEEQVEAKEGLDRVKELVKEHRSCRAPQEAQMLEELVLGNQVRWKEQEDPIVVVVQWDVEVEVE